MKRIVVTGGAGFLGSHLSKALLEKGWQVTVIDDLSQGNLENIKDFFSSSQFAFYQKDILDKNFILDISKGADLLVHFATYKIPREGEALQTIEINTKGTETILEVGKENGLRIVFGSTDDVYGKNPEPPFSEESALVLGNPRSFRWTDAITKIYSEQLCLAYYNEYQLPVNILRFSIIYGPGQRRDWRGGPIGVFIDKALKEDPIPIHGDGLQIRNFVFVSDAIAGVLKLIEREEIRGEVINIGSSEHVRIIDLAYQIWFLVGNLSKPKIEFIAYPDLCADYEDSKHKDLDITKAKYLLGYEPKVSLKVGLERTIDWFRKYFRA